MTRNKNMQQHIFYDEEKNPSDDDYIWAGGEDGTRNLRRPTAAQQQQLPWGSRFPPPSKYPASWFTLTESTFNRHNVVDSRLCFDLVLPALPEQVI